MHQDLRGRSVAGGSTAKSAALKGFLQAVAADPVLQGQCAATNDLAQLGQREAQRERLWPGDPHRALAGAGGGFNPRYRPAYCEGTDRCLRVREASQSHSRRTDQGLKQHQVRNLEQFKVRWRHTLDTEQPPEGMPWLQATCSACHWTGRSWIAGCWRSSYRRAGPRIGSALLGWLDQGDAAHPCQTSRRSICTPGKREPASRLVAASMRWGSPPPLAGHTSTACCSGISSQPSWAPLAW